MSADILRSYLFSLFDYREDELGGLLKKMQLH